MKSLPLLTFLALILTTILTTRAAFSSENDSFACYKKGEADPYIYDDIGARYLSILCSNAPSADSPIDCYKNAIGDIYFSDLLYNKHLAFLCSQARSDAPIDCFKMAYEDNTIRDLIGSPLRIVGLCGAATSQQPVVCFLERLNAGEANDADGQPVYINKLIRLCSKNPSILDYIRENMVPQR